MAASAAATPLLRNPKSEIRNPKQIRNPNTETQTPSAFAQSSVSTGSSVQVTIPPSVTQNGFTGSVPESKVSAEPLQISFLGAIDRGLRQNLGLLLSSDETIAARGEKWSLPAIIV